MTYFVKLDDGKELRRKLLESSKLAIQVLKEEQEIIELREKKKSLLSQASKELKELNKLLGKLQNTMPQLTKKELEELKPVVKKSTKKIPKKGSKKSSKKIDKKSSPKTEVTKLDKLESSLKLIEERLNKI